ncbi:hypothetical protein LIA77_10697 [Sarocladium implicatum]|nr:hypothetical protein LIA77_10697 [Sarocladium implicatum]
MEIHLNVLQKPVPRFVASLKCPLHWKKRARQSQASLRPIEDSPTAMAALTRICLACYRPKHLPHSSILSVRSVRAQTSVKRGAFTLSSPCSKLRNSNNLCVRVEPSQIVNAGKI